MKKLRKYQDRIYYNEYDPKSQLHAEETVVSASCCPVIDAHTHFGCRILGENFEKRYETGNVIEKLQKIGVRKCVELTLFNRENWERIHEKLANYTDYFAFCAPVDFSNYGKPHFQATVSKEMERYAQEGAVGFKVWKNLGFEVCRGNGEVVPLNDPSIRFIWEKAAELSLPVVMHIADPPAYFEPADKYNERLEELNRFYFWHHYQKGFSFDGFMQQFDLLLQDNPDTLFLAAHLCSCPGNLNFVSEMLRKHPNLYTDTAAVLADIGRQPRRFKAFAEEFSDRVLFGTDFFAGDPLPHLPYFRFFQTEDEYFRYNVSDNLEHGRWRIYGCGLGDDLIKKLYYQNAESFFGLNTEDGR